MKSVLSGVWRQTLPETPVFNPAFDVTPHENIRAIVTEKGIIHRPDAVSVPAFFQH